MQQQCVNASTNFVGRRALLLCFLGVLITAKSHLLQELVAKLNQRGFQLKILARAVFILDGEGVVQYVQVVPEVAEEPDYDSAIAAVDKLLA